MLVILNTEKKEEKKAFHHVRKNKNKKAKRNSGGILVLYKKHLCKYLKVKNKENENVIWITIDKELMKTENNLLLGTIYISPINSSIYNGVNTSLNTFDGLFKQLASFDKNEAILLGGDFNATIGNLEDFI